MSETMTIQPIGLDKIAPKAAELKDGGWRLVQMCASDMGDDLEILYTFAKETDWENFRVNLPKTGDFTLPSISPSFLCAFSYENEMKDLFGIKVDGLVIDYKGHFIQTEKKTPWAKPPETKPDEAAGPACVAPPDDPEFKRVPGDQPVAAKKEETPKAPEAKKKEAKPAESKENQSENGE